MVLVVIHHKMPTNGTFFDSKHYEAKMFSKNVLITNGGLA